MTPTSDILFVLWILPSIACAFLNFGGAQRKGRGNVKLHSSIHSGADNHLKNDAKYNRELFSVAPMMGHTNRHYRFFFRLLSKRAHLYTEMIPAPQVVNAYERALSNSSSKTKTGRNGIEFHSDEIQDVVLGLGREDHDNRGSVNSLSEMLRLSTPGEHPVTLQLGGRDERSLAMASAVGAAFGYDAINLNCGCPSNAVSMGDRSGGVALMRDPDHVARCVEAMNSAIRAVASSSDHEALRETKVTVKHRLGVLDASDYDRENDQKKGDGEALESCRNFVRAVTLGGHVATMHVHARLGLLGEFERNEAKDATQNRQLWVPGQDAADDQNTTKGKIDHKREQYRAKRRARMATIQNRNVPPLRPNIVRELAAEFPEVDFVANGGMKTMDDVRERICHSSIGNCSMSAGKVMGAMVGRAVINHPCSFASADSLWDNSIEKNKKDPAFSASRPSRGEVLRDYISYCEREEQRVIGLGANSNSMDALRRRLVAVPFNLFSGEDGNDRYQRRIRKLVSRVGRHTASSILNAGLSEVPLDSLNKCVDLHTPHDEIQVYDFTRRSGPLQRSIW